MGDIQRRVTQIGKIRFGEEREKESADPTSTSEAQQSRALERDELKKVSPVRGIAVNTDRSSFISTRSSGPAPKRPRKDIGSTPQQKYHEFMSLDQAGPATIAYDSVHNLYAIKKVRLSANAEVGQAQLFTGVRCVVNVRDLYRVDDEITIVYECMDVSLKHILATPRGHMNSSEIAMICREVSEGLNYIHHQLDVYHGSLSCEELLLDRAGGYAESDDAWNRYQDVLESELHVWYGAENDLAAWHALCRTFGVEPLPKTCEQCEEAVRRTHVNIVNLIEWGRSDSEEKVHNVVASSL